MLEMSGDVKSQNRNKVLKVCEPMNPEELAKFEEIQNLKNKFKH